MQFRSLVGAAWPTRRGCGALREALRLKPDYEDAKKQLRQLGVEK